MEIRKDLSSAKTLLERLYEYSKVFIDYNHKQWSHLKNREDFDKIYELPNDIKNAFDSIYSTGRDISIYMGSHLQEFNYPDSYPTITSYIETFTNNWVSVTDDLKELSSKAKSYSNNLNNTPWAVQRMIVLFDRQLELLEAIKTIILQIKKTEIYKLENPENVDEEFPTIKMKNKPFWTFIKSIKGIISIIIMILTILVGIYALRDSVSFREDIKSINQDEDSLRNNNKIENSK